MPRRRRPAPFPKATTALNQARRLAQLLRSRADELTGLHLELAALLYRISKEGLYRQAGRRWMKDLYEELGQSPVTLKYHRQLGKLMHDVGPRVRMGTWKKLGPTKMRMLVIAITRRGLTVEEIPEVVHQYKDPAVSSREMTSELLSRKPKRPVGLILETPPDW